jgi:hypothetical protein
MYVATLSSMWGPNMYKSRYGLLFCNLMHHKHNYHIILRHKHVLSDDQKYLFFKYQNANK